MNINVGHNRKMLEKCRPLGEYAWFVDQVRRYSRETDIETAVDRALDEMPDDYVIKRYLIGNRTEVKMSCLTEYNEVEEKRRIERKAEARGIAIGESRGIAIGESRGISIMVRKLADYFLAQDPTLTGQEAMDKATAIANQTDD